MKPVDRGLYPFAPHHFDRGGGVRMHYVDIGPSTEAAGTVLCLHGNPSWSFYFRNVVKALEATHRVIAPDHVGMGLSDKPGDDAYGYTLQERVDDLTTLIDALELQGPLTLVAHDWGGMIAFKVAVTFPQRIRRLIANDFAAAFAQCDVVVGPTSPTVAFGLGAKSSDPVQMYLNDIFTVTVNMAGLPGIATPAGLSREGLPLGLQLIGRPFDEETLFSLGQVIENAAGRFKPHSWW